MRLVSLIAALAFAAPAFAVDASREWRFNVSLDGRPIGEHLYRLRETGSERELTSEARFRVRILFIEAYRYDHRAEERWQGDCLESLEAKTDSNGELTSVAGTSERGGFRLQGAASTPLAACVQTFAYWNPSILGARRLLNPQTGEYVNVTVEPMGTELLNGQSADRFRLLGAGKIPLQIDLWYSPAREWLALESLTPEGRRLRYARQ